MSRARGSLGLLLALAVVLVLGLAPSAEAHEFRPGLLRVTEQVDAPGRWDLRLVSPAVSEAGPIEAGDLRPIVPAQCTIRPRSELAFVLECGAEGLVGTLGVAGLERHPIDVMLELRYADATRFNAVLGPDSPTIELVDAAEQRGSVFRDYLGLGVEHILLGFDHLLFVLGLVLLVGARVRASVPRAASEQPASTRSLTRLSLPTLLATVTAFTVAHSVTLAASALELVELPSAPVEAGIALSIVLLARELALALDTKPSGPGSPGRSGERLDTLTWRYPWLVAFAFGLLHGFGFAGALREIGLPPSQTPLALLAFNLGVEAGQLAVVAVLLLGFVGLRRLAAILALSPEREQLARRIPIWAMGALACAWTLERVLGFWG